MKKEINSAKAPAAVGPYSQGIGVNGLLFISGQLPIDAKTGTMPESAEEQAKQSLENVKAILASEGKTMANIVKTTVLLTDMGDFAAVNKVYESYFEKPFPARSCFAVVALPKGAKVEIEVIVECV